MNVSSFANNNFDSREWINNVFKEQAKQDVTDVMFVKSMANKLHSLIQQVQNGLVDNIQLISEDLPNMIEHINLLKRDAITVHQEILRVKEELLLMRKNSSGSIISLERIDNIKSDLESAKEALHEADNWMVLASNIEEVFISGNVDAITEKLVSMQQSLNVFSSSDDYEGRRMQLEGYKNRLEAVVSPRIAHAFTISDTEEACKIYKIFTAIERVPQLLRYYIKCQEGYLFQQWKNLVDSDQDQQLELIRAFYNLLLTTWQSQLKWCLEVFPSVNMNVKLGQLYADVLISVDPSLTSCLDLSLKQHSQPLLLLLQFHQASVNFHNNLQLLYFSNPEVQKNKLESENMIKSIYAPYHQYASRYGTLERQLLEELLWNTCLNSQTEDLVDTIQNVGCTVSIMINIANEAKNRCLQFTQGCSYPGLISALRGYFLKYIEMYKKIVKMLAQRSTGEENWKLFHLCLSLQQIIGELSKEIKNYDSSLVYNIASNQRQLLADQYIKSLLTADAEKEYRELLSSVLNGSKTSVLDGVNNIIEKLCYETHKIAFEVVFGPITMHLENGKCFWKKLNKEPMQQLPDYSYSPLEYITQIGEYLITLPQHLEPFLQRDSAQLVHLLSAVDAEFKNVNNGLESGGYANLFLMVLMRGVCNAYYDQILSMHQLNTFASKQLAVDIDYLGNVLEELGVGLTVPLQHIAMLLHLQPENYQTKSVGCPPKLVAVIRQIRNIPPS